MDGLAFDIVCEAVALAGQGVRLAVIDTELHSTRDVHADGEGITALSVASAPSISRP